MLLRTADITTTLETINIGVLAETFSEWMPGLIRFGINIVLALVILFIGSRVIKVIYNILQRSFKRMDIDASLGRFLLSLIRAGLYVVLIFIIAGQIGINSASIIALLGSAGIAIGLAVQGSLSNFAGGVLILMMRPFRVGDYIISKDGEGTVTVIGLVYSTLLTIDNKSVVIPNGNLANSPLTNVTAHETRRVDILVGISYDSDLKKAKEIVEEVYSTHELVLKEKEITVYVDALDRNSVNIGGRGWVLTSDYWNVRWELIERIKLTFDEHGIEIPFDQIDVHLKKQED